MKYNPDIHHRRSVRIKDYDYSQSGIYFVTLCVQHREFLFGEIVNNEMRLNDAGKMINQWWSKIKTKFVSIGLDEYIIMPNHLHGIIVSTVEAHQQARPKLSEIVQWFKTMTTNEYIRCVKNNDWRPFNKKLWQRNYYEHVVRNEKSLDMVRCYINNNPLNWHNDEMNIVGVSHF